MIMGIFLSRLSSSISLSLSRLFYFFAILASSLFQTVLLVISACLLLEGLVWWEGEGGEGSEASCCGCFCTAKYSQLIHKRKFVAAVALFPNCRPCHTLPTTCQPLHSCCPTSASHFILVVVAVALFVAPPAWDFVAAFFFAPCPSLACRMLIISLPDYAATFAAASSNADANNADKNGYRVAAAALLVRSGIWYFPLPNFSSSPSFCCSAVFINKLHF